MEFIKKLTRKQILDISALLALVILVGATVFLLNRQNNVSVTKPRANIVATVGSCDIEFTIPSPTPTLALTPTPPAGTVTPTPTPTAYTTRTLGYWQTHTEYTSSIFANNLGGTMKIGYSPHKGFITNIQQPKKSQLFGAFYSGISKKSNGVTRLAIDRARMQLLQQLVATKLNCAAFGCPTNIQTLISNSDTAYATGTASQMLNYASQLDVYNNSGDSLPLGPQESQGLGPQESQNLADIPFWDAP